MRRNVLERGDREVEAAKKKEMDERNAQYRTRIQSLKKKYVKTRHSEKLPLTPKL